MARQWIRQRTTNGARHEEMHFGTFLVAGDGGCKAEDMKRSKCCDGKRLDGSTISAKEIDGTMDSTIKAGKVTGAAIGYFE